MCTMRDKNDHHQGVLLEDMNHKFDVILEYLKPLSGLPAKVDRIDERLERVESDVKVVKVVLKDHSKDIAELSVDVKTIKLAVKGQADDHQSLVKRVAKHWNDRRSGEN